MRIRAITFDCWGTLIFEPDPAAAHAVRIAALEAVARRTGARRSGPREALDVAWRRQMQLWYAGRACGPDEIAGFALSALGVEAPEERANLARELARAALAGEVHALDGARRTLEHAAGLGLRRALVCDTGFSPGAVVRELLDRAGLLELLEVRVFSDEAGVPKPDRRIFERALEPLGVEPGEAVHVGDLRRTDVAGARACGMQTVRIRAHHDDPGPLDDADWVVDSHAELVETLRLR